MSHEHSCENCCGQTDNEPMVICDECEEAIRAGEKHALAAATEAALRWAWGHDPFVSPYDKWMSDGRKALLGEDA